MMAPMRRSRRHIVTALVVLILQMGVALSAATSLCGTLLTAESAMDDDACCQGLAPGQMCPMHKHRGGGGHKPSHEPGSASEGVALEGRVSEGGDSAGGPGGCVMISACGTQPAGLEALTLGLGIPPVVASTIDHPRAGVIVFAPASITPRSLLPDLQPPRA